VFSIDFASKGQKCYYCRNAACIASPRAVCYLVTQRLFEDKDLFLLKITIVLCPALFSGADANTDAPAFAGAYPGPYVAANTNANVAPD
jgi:hypothetical protein